MNKKMAWKKDDIEIVITDTPMDKILTNQSFAGRREKVKGKDFAVYPVILMVEGVHHAVNGSPVFYPLSTLQDSALHWEGRPIPVMHPNVGGDYVRANNPHVEADWVVGRIYNASVQNGKLKGEAWIEVKEAERIAPGLIMSLDSGTQMEVSTGVLVQGDGTVGAWNGEQFNQTITSMVPDHLALLPGDKGACSWEDGCGIRANAECRVPAGSSAGGQFSKCGGIKFEWSGGSVDIEETRIRIDEWVKTSSDKDLTLMYQETQDFYKQLNIKDILLYRVGLINDNVEQTTSWSSNKEMAELILRTKNQLRKHFNIKEEYKLVQKNISIKRILASYQTHKEAFFSSESFNEFEFIVLPKIPSILQTNTQCRVPAGNPDGGQFSSCDGGSGHGDGVDYEIEQETDIINILTGVSKDTFDNFDLIPHKSRVLKESVSQTLGWQLGISEKVASDLLRIWANSSNDHDFRSLTLQKAVGEEFGIELTDWQKERIKLIEIQRNDRFKDVSVNSLEGKFTSVDEYLNRVNHSDKPLPTDISRKAVRQIYENTQKRLKDAGLTHVTVYRGIVYDEYDQKIFKKIKDGTLESKSSDGRYSVHYKGNSIESWSVVKDMAEEFADTPDRNYESAVFRMTVPIARVFSLPTTGVGSLVEGEVVLLAGKNDKARML